MATVTIHSEFRAQERGNQSLLPPFPLLFAMKWWDQMPWSSVQFSCSVVSDSLWPHRLQHAMPLCPSPTPRIYLNSCPLSRWCYLLNHLILCSLLLPPSIFPSIRIFSNESPLRIRWPKYWNFSFNISPSSEYSGLISFRVDSLDLLAVQGTLKSLLQHHSHMHGIFWGRPWS